MASNLEFLAKATEAVRPHVDEQLLAVGLCSRPGATSNAFAAQVSGLWAILRERKAKQAAGGLPRNMAVAVTPTRLVVLEYKPRGRGIAVKGVAAVLDRQGLVVQADPPGRLSCRLRLSWPDGRTVELDALRGMGGDDMSAPFLAALGVTPGANVA